MYVFWLLFRKVYMYWYLASSSENHLYTIQNETLTTGWEGRVADGNCSPSMDSGSGGPDSISGSRWPLCCVLWQDSVLWQSLYDFQLPSPFSSVNMGTRKFNEGDGDLLRWACTQIKTPFFPLISLFFNNISVKIRFLEKKRLIRLPAAQIRPHNQKSRVLVPSLLVKS